MSEYYVFKEISSAEDNPFCTRKLSKLSFQISDLCRHLISNLLSDWQNTTRNRSYHIQAHLNEQDMANHEVKKAAFLAIKQEADNTKAIEKAARGAQEAAEEAEEKAMEAKAEAFYQ